MKQKKVEKNNITLRNKLQVVGYNYKQSSWKGHKKPNFCHARKKLKILISLNVEWPYNYKRWLKVYSNITLFLLGV